MPSDALAIAPVILAVVLVLSAIGKLRAPRASAEAFRDLRVPAPLAGRTVIRALPWAELALALLLVVAGGWLGVAAAAALLLLFTAYLLLVVRALGFEQPVDCACFGEFAPGRITARTVVRNAWLLTLAIVALLLSFGGLSPLERLAAGVAAWAWLAAVAATAATTYLVAGAAPAPQEAAATTTTSGDELEDYIRTPTPAVSVTLGDGSTTDLRTLSRVRAQLLLFVSETCGSCTPVIESAMAWRSSMPQLDVRYVLSSAPDSSGLTSTEDPQTIHDPARAVRESFAIQGTPAALVLGADGMLAGGPVLGSSAVEEFVAEIEQALRTASVDETRG